MVIKMANTGDPITDFLRRVAEQQEWLDKRPVCEYCGEPIQEERAFYYADQWFCVDKKCEKEFMEMVWEDIRKDFLITVED